MDGVAENRLRAGLAGLVAIAPDETARILFTQIARSPL